MEQQQQLTGPITLQERAEVTGLRVAEIVRRGGLPWLDAALVATDDARARIRRWIAAGSPAPPFDRLHCYADDQEFRALIVAVLRRMAPPAAEHAIRTSIVVGVGRSKLGWVYHGAEVPPPAALEPLRIVAITGARADADVQSIAAHEFSHGWLMPSLPATVPDDTDDAQAWLDRMAAIVAREPDCLAEAIAAGTLHERQACRLARVWGFPGPGTDTAAATRRIVQRLETAAKEIA